MANICKVCNHPEVDKINQALISGASLRDIAGQFSLSKSSISRHKANCLPASLVQAKKADDILSADDLIDKIDKFLKRAEAILNRNDGNDDRVALMAIREANRSLELLGKLKGQIDQAPKIAILINSPEWEKVRAVITKSLEDYPEALEAVDHGLQSLSA